MNRRTLCPGVVLALAAMAAGGAGTAGVAGAAGTRSVTLKDIAFTPERLQVSKGTTVVFRWRDDETSHDVTSVGRKRFKSLSERRSGTARVRFARAGTYRYVCTLHPGMDGRITVR